MLRRMTRQISSQCATSSSCVVPFAVHSTFRDEMDQKARPNGLVWDMMGDSHLSYVVRNMDDSDNDAMNDIEQSISMKRGIVEAHNRWCFAQDLTYKSIHDISRVTPQGPHHFHVEWKDEKDERIIIPTKVSRYDNVIDMLMEDDAAKGDGETAEVWFNGVFLSVLDGPSSLDPIVETISHYSSTKLLFKRYDGFIRVDRIFTGYLRNRDQVFLHIMDNLIALEDPEVLDDNTLIGTATLPDWILGGMLTSRLWIQELENGNVLFLRPLRNDDVKTSDRRFELVKGSDDEKIETVQIELSRLRYLANITHPFQVDETKEPDHLADVRKKLAANKKRRKYFGL